MSTASDQFC